MIVAALQGRVERWQRWPALLGLALQVRCLLCDKPRVDRTGGQPDFQEGQAFESNPSCMGNQAQTLQPSLMGKQLSKALVLQDPVWGYAQYDPVQDCLANNLGCFAVCARWVLASASGHACAWQTTADVPGPRSLPASKAGSPLHLAVHDLEMHL